MRPYFLIQEQRNQQTKGVEKLIMTKAIKILAIGTVLAALGACAAHKQAAVTTTTSHTYAPK